MKRKCKNCNKTEHMTNGLDTRYNMCYKCKPNLDEDPGEFIYSENTKIKDLSFNDELNLLDDMEDANV